MNKVSWTIFAALTVGILALLVVFSNSSQVDVSKVDTNAVQKANEEDGNIADHVLGKTGSEVILIEYGDYECSHCGAINPAIINLVEEYQDQMQFVFRNFPLGGGYANSKAAAKAVEAAGLQEKFWEAHDAIYADQAGWSTLDSNALTDYFNEFASKLGLDLTKFKTDMGSDAVTDKIVYDRALGVKAGVEGTPTFYLNGKKLEIQSTEEATIKKFKAAINDALRKAGIALPEAEQ